MDATLTKLYAAMELAKKCRDGCSNKNDEKAKRYWEGRVDAFSEAIEMVKGVV